MEIRFPHVKTTTEKAFIIYHQNPFLDTKLVMELFSCSRATALRICKIAKTVMDEREIKYHCETLLIDKDILYEIAGLNINQINKSYKIMKNLNS